MNELRYALRRLWKRPAFTFVAVTTLALGIGSVTALFSVVDAVLLSGLPYEDADELVRVWSSNRTRGIDRGPMSPPDIADFQARTRSLEALAAYAEEELALERADGTAIKVTGAWAGDNLFAVLGARPALGRAFTPADGRPGAARVVVLAHDFWVERFGGDPGALGQTLVVEEDAYTVIGVMPEGFDFPGASRLWLNRHLLAYPGRYARWMDVVGRMGDGETLASVRSDLGRVADELAAEYPDTNRDYDVRIASLQDAVVGETRPVLLILLSATGLLLLVACVNVISLLMSRLSERGVEVSLRTALGAGRSRLARQMLVENFVLAGAGALAGLVVAVVGVELLLSLGSGSLPRLDEVDLDARVLAISLLAALLSGGLFGIGPIAWLARSDPSERLRGGRTPRGTAWARAGLVVAEISLAVMLVVGAGLLSRSFMGLLRTDPGFDVAGVLTLQVDLPGGTYADLERVADYVARTTDRLEALPGVESVGATASLPFAEEAPFLGDFRVEGRDPAPRGEEPRGHYRQVAPGYFETLGIELLDGRAFRAGDDREAPGVAVIDRIMAERYFGDENPIGRVIDGLPPHLALGGFLVEGFEIVGVVEDVRYAGLAESPQPSLYLPLAQAPFRRISFVVRAESDPLAMAGPVRSTLRDFDPGVPISRVATLGELRARSLARERFATLLLAAFAAAAALLAAVGVYGVVSYEVSKRRRELGIRMAVGADPRGILSLVMRDGARLAVFGVAGGLVGAWFLTRFMASQLHGISPTDPATFGAVGLALTLIALLATYLPAARAARVDAAVTLQREGP